MQGLPRRLGALSVSLIALGLILFSCASPASGRPRPLKEPDPRRVEAYSGPLVGSKSEIRVVLAEAPAEPSSAGSLARVAGSAAPAGAFRFYPALAGQARWEDERTLAFSPARPLKAGVAYRAEVDLGLLERRPQGGGASAGSDDYFSFDFRSGGQRLSVEAEPPRVGAGGVTVEGSLDLGESAPNAAAEAALSSSKGRISWNHESGTDHRFTVSGIAASPSGGELVLRWDGKSVGGGGKGKTIVKLPASSRFELLAASPVGAGSDAGSDLGAGSSSPSRGVELAFSRELEGAQDLRGVVSVDGVRDLRYRVSGSTVSLYSESWPASAKVRVERSLRDSDGRILAVPAAATVNFDWEKPQVRFLTKGNILPTSQGLALPIETMNLSGVIVEALRVYGDNMLQFLQVNDLDGDREMKRVGEVVWRKDIDLGWKDDWKNRWVRQGLDLGPLVDKYKDGMFQIRITFRKGDIRYVCPNNHDFKDLRFPDEKVIDNDDGEYSFWNYVEEWGGRYDDYYKYKNDPCHPAYYLPSYDHDITVKRNVLVSDIGASIAREADGAWHLAASDLRSAKPLAGATVSLYSYQRRLLAQGKTEASGLCVLRAQGEAAFATVASGDQASWLKVDSGSTLAVGHFDIGGEKADSGLKGFIYGERGVWRPGDDIHLGFILYDRTGKLPADFPVSFELEDPMGRVVRTGTYTESLNGFYAIKASTAGDAMTGTYLAIVRAGGRTFSKSLKIETVMPNRLKIDLGWGGASSSGLASAGGSMPPISSDTKGMSLAASWLTGAKVGALKADVSATFAATDSGFSSLPDYTFDDPTREAPQDRAILFEGRLGSDGKTSFDIDLGQGSGSDRRRGSGAGLPPGKLRANILTRVFEPSGVFSSESTSADFHPYERYVGIRLPKGDAARGMLLVDKDQRVDLALVDREGRLVKGGAKIEVALYQLEWRWWWEKGDESLAQRADELFQKPIKKETVTIGPDGRGSWTFQIKYPNWGRYLLRAQDVSSPAGPSSGHAAGKIAYIDWPGWAGRGRDSGGAQAMLELTAGAPKYAPGERASVSFPSNELGRALVRVERSGKILREEWIQAKKDTTAYEFAVTPEMAPNVYVHVTFVQPHLQTANDLPIRLYGIIPIMVEDPATRLSPIVETPATLSPGGEASFTVREAKGRPMTYTVAVVDEGLLGITRYQAPDPWNDFYKKEASALSSWDLYQYVMGAYSGKLETLLAVGGSDEGLGGGNRKPSRFPAVVYYFPPAELKAGEVAKKSFKLGTYIGALRFMVVAGSMPAQSAAAGSGAAEGRGAAFGVAQKSVPVRADIMAQLTAPRVLSPDEEAAIPATVFAFMGANRASLRLEASGALSLVGDGKASLDFAQDGDLSTSFRVKAASAPGRGKLRLVASMGGKSSEQSVDLEVRSVGLPVTKVLASDIGGGKSWDAEVELPGLPGTNSISVELSRLRSLDLAERVDYLIRYPHGCAEQTTSAAFPQLYLPKAAALDEERAKEARDNVARAIDRLRSFQTPRGGFAMWPGSGEESEWISAYVSHFLVSSRREGFEVPQGLLDPALEYLARSARGWNSNEAWSQSTQAYRLYVLARAGRAEVSAMNRLRDFPGLPTAARYRLAAAYALSGMREAANAAVRGLSTEVSDYEGLYDYTYGSTTRERAVVLDALLAMGDTARALPVYNKLAEELSGGRWLSTQELGMALGAALPYAIQASTAEGSTASVSLNGSAAKELRLDRPMARVDLEAPAGDTASVSVKNAGGGPIFARIVARGTPAAGGEKPLANGLQLGLRYLGMDGRQIDPARIAMGSDFIVEAAVQNRSGVDLKDLALTQLMPSGWEIANYRVGSDLPKPKSDDEESSSRAKPRAQAPLYDYQDIRDDRVLTYFSLGAKESKVFKLYLNKAYEGDFFLPATSVYAMYDEERYQALSPGRWLSAPAPAQNPAPGKRAGIER